MKKFEAYPVYLFMQFCHGLFFMIYATVSMVYQVSSVGLDPFQLVLVGTVLETSYFLLEIPTGVVADVYSRRLSILIGFVVMGLGFMLAGAIPRFDTLLLAQVIWGGGATFLSGATEAWIADELTHKRKSAQIVAGHTKTNNADSQQDGLGQVYLRGEQAHQLGRLIGAGISVFLASIALALPLVVGGALFVVLAFVLALIMPEDSFTRVPTEERDSWQAVGQTAHTGFRLIRGHPILIAILASSALLGAWTEGFDRLWTKHLIDNFTFPALGAFEPVVWFGIIQAVTLVLTLGLAEWLRRRVNIDNHQAIVRVLIPINLLLMVSVLFFALTTDFTLALIAFWLVGMLRSILNPLFATWINQFVDSEVRATVLSIVGQADAIGQVGGGPLIGAVGRFTSLRVALSVGGLILLPVSLIYGRLLNRARAFNDGATYSTTIKNS